MGYIAPRILVFHPEEAAANAYAESIRQAGYHSVFAASSAEEASRRLAGTEVILCWKFPTQLLKSPSASSVKWIQSMGAGVDDLASNPDISASINLTRIVGQFGGPIAEFVLGYLLYLTKDIQRIRNAQEQCRWEPFSTDFLQGKTIGVAGLGSIGLEIVRKARVFDMKVFGLSFSGKQAHLVDQHFMPGEWNRFVQDLDYLVLTLPLTSETYHVVNRDVLLAMKPKAILVNVGRGQLVVEQDLLDVLHSGHLRAAVLDVFEQEPLPKESPFWSTPNVFVTPHLSGPSIPEEVSRFFIDNLKRYQEGKPMHGVVNRALGY